MRKDGKIKKLTPFFILLLLPLIFFNVFDTRAYADSPAEYVSFKIEFEDGNKIFYMTLPDEETEEQLKTGLYYSTGENIYLFEKNYSFYESDMVFSNDGLCFAYFPWATSEFNPDKRDLTGTAIMFFRNGTLIREYTVGQVLKNANEGVYSVSHVSWEKYEERKFVSSEDILFVTARDNKWYRFYIRTGEIIQSSKGNTGAGKNTYCSNVVITNINGGGMGLVAIAIIFMLMKRKRNNPLTI